jgi:hypothetical protein
LDCFYGIFSVNRDSNNVPSYLRTIPPAGLRALRHKLRLWPVRELLVRRGELPPADAGRGGRRLPLPDLPAQGGGAFSGAKHGKVIGAAALRAPVAML